jgi:hypothetical protein
MKRLVSFGFGLSLFLTLCSALSVAKTHVELKDAQGKVVHVNRHPRQGGRLQDRSLRQLRRPHRLRGDHEVTPSSSNERCIDSLMNRA